MDHTVEKNLSSAVRFRATNKTGLQVVRDILFLVPFIGLFGSGFVFLVFLEECVKSIDGFVGKTKFLRNIRVEPDAFFFLGRSASGIRTTEQINNQRAILAPDFELQIFQIISDVFEVLYRKVQERIVLKELIVVIDLRRNKIALPILANVFANRVLKGGNQLHILTLDSDHKAIRAAKSFERFFESLYARRIFGQKVRQVGIEL